MTQPASPAAPAPASRPRWHGWAVPAVILVAGLASVAANPGLRSLFAQAARQIDPLAVLVTLPVQLVAILVCTAAQQALNIGVPFRASFLARLTRDAGHNLLIFPPGMGEAIGARMLVLAGGKARAALMLRVLDVAAEVLAELPYMALAGWVVAGFWLGGHGAAGLPSGGGASAAHGWLVAGGMVALVLLLVGLAARRWWRGLPQGHRLRRRIAAEWHLLRREMHRQRTGLPLAIGLHVIGWGLSGVQVWLAAGVFGLHLSLFSALAIESAATSARVILFFVPGGLVMQEAGAVLAGAALGVPAPMALALSLVLRLRDVAFGAALLLWPAMEWRARRQQARPRAALA
ncbi:MAG TPA: lysylphosphatidylglycerol synthase domain-containing protein [Novosphingobium sp.]|nr:lysylphosphatidylglycerol synthase domain-containing protein [Novosphingobium sp.]